MIIFSYFVSKTLIIPLIHFCIFNI